MSNRHLINNISGEICQENVSTEMCPTHCMAGDIEERILEVMYRSLVETRVIHGLSR